LIPLSEILYEFEKSNLSEVKDFADLKVCEMCNSSLSEIFDVGDTLILMERKAFRLHNDFLTVLNLK